MLKFFGNLLLGESNELRNRDLQVKEFGTVNDTVKANVGTVNDTVLSLLKEDSHLTSDELAQKLGISIRTVKRRIKGLKDSGIIERVGSDKTGFWHIKE